MASFRKAIFPNFVNSPRVILFWEADELRFVSFVLIFVFTLLFLSNAPTPLVVVGVALIVPVSLEGYRRLTKEAAPNWLEHFLYDKGLSPGINKMFLVRNGYDRDSDIIPPSFITVFED